MSAIRVIVDMVKRHHTNNYHMRHVNNGMVKDHQTNKWNTRETTAQYNGTTAE